MAQISDKLQSKSSKLWTPDLPDNCVIWGKGAMFALIYHLTDFICMIFVFFFVFFAFKKNGGGGSAEGPVLVLSV